MTSKSAVQHASCSIPAYLRNDGKFMTLSAPPSECSIPKAQGGGKGCAERRLLTVSPYLEEEHLLDLSSIDVQNQLLAEALGVLQPTSEKYATTSYDLCLNWSAVQTHLRELVSERGIRWLAMEFYVVEFRSKLKSNIDRPLLFQLDKESHREATESGGLLKYWFGSPDAERRNLATCLWRSKQDAIKGGRGPWHKKARGAVSQMYETINVKGLKLRIGDNVSSWTFGPFV